MRAFGYRVVDQLVQHFIHLRDDPVTHKRTPADMQRRLREPAPEQGMAPEAVLGQVTRDVFESVSRTHHPRFFAYVPAPSNFVSVMADALAAGYNVFAGHWLAGSGAAEAERVTIDWLCRLCGLPETAGGLFVSGGSMANLTAIATARVVHLGEHSPDAVLYCSDQTHSSLQKGMRVLGFHPDQTRSIPTDDDFRLVAPALTAQIARDRAAGRRPFCVVANAGTTSTGAVDPLVAVSEVCRAEGLWMHIDGAYGAAAVLCDEGRRALDGLHLADSITIDPHKWWFQPFEIGGLLVREPQYLRQAFSVRAGYLKETYAGDEEINYYDHGVQLTRGFRALKLWMSIKVFGLAAFREAVAGGFRQARFAESLLRDDAAWEIVTPAQLGIVTFRYRSPGLDADAVDAVTRGIVDRMLVEAFAMVTSTELLGRSVLRLCPIHPETTEDDIRETIALLKHFGEVEATALAGV